MQEYNPTYQPGYGSWVIDPLTVLRGRSAWRRTGRINKDSRAVPRISHWQGSVGQTGQTIVSYGLPVCASHPCNRRTCEDSIAVIAYDNVGTPQIDRDCGGSPDSGRHCNAVLVVAVR